MRSAPELRVIIVGASSDEAAGIVIILKQGGYSVKPRCAYNARAFELSLEKHPFDMAFWCESGAGFSLVRGIQIITKLGKNIPLVELRSQVDERDRVESLRAGACDVVLKHNKDHLALVVDRELAKLSHYRKVIELERRYTESQKNCFELLQSSKNAVAFIANGRHVHANPSYRQLFGYSYMTELKGLPVKELAVGVDARRVDDFVVGLERSGGSGEIDLAALGSGGSQFRVSFKFDRASINGQDAYRIIARDLSRRRKETDLPSNRFDPLTGLVNHQHFLELLETEVSSTREEGGKGVLMLIELEHFRSIRATVGIAGSDLVIRDLAEVAHQLTSSAHTFARFADHTFTLYIPQSEVSDAVILAEKVRSGIESHISDAAGQSVSASCSIGVVAINRMTTDAQAALTHADIACRSAIHAGGNAVRVYEPAEYGIDEDRGKTLTGTEIREAMSDDRIELRFHPIISLHGDNVEVFQVDARMRDEFDNVIDHDTLLAAAAASDCEGHLDRWIVEQMLLEWGTPNGPSQTAQLLIRLSDESVKDPSLVLHLGRMLRKTGADASRLIFEVSESAATGYVRYARGFVKALKRLGCMAALARFGAGSNSFRTLKHLDVDFLKIEEEVMKDLVDNPASQSAIRSIQETARLNNKATIATKVQDANSLALLWELGVNYVQGDYIQGLVIELGSPVAEIVTPASDQTGVIH